MANKVAFQEKIRQLGELVGDLDALAGGGSSNAAARELVQLLMEVHGAGLERLLEIVYESGAAGEAIIAKAGHDLIVRHLLLLYSLHPEGIQTRVLKALDEAAPRLHKLNSQAALLGVREGVIQVKVSTSGHACGSTGKSAQSIVEECIYDFAPDLASLEILGPEDAPSSGFVSLESLINHPASTQAMPMQSAEMCGAE